MTAWNDSSRGRVFVTDGTVCGEQSGLLFVNVFHGILELLFGRCGFCSIVGG